MNTTSDPKEHTIRVRLNEEMYSHVLRESADGTISDYIRNLIQRDMTRMSISLNPEKIKRVCIGFMHTLIISDYSKKCNA